MEKVRNNTEAGLNKANADHAHFQSLLDMLILFLTISKSAFQRLSTLRGCKIRQAV